MSRIQQAALHRDNEREALVRAGMRDVAPLAVQIRAATIRAFRSGNNTATAIAHAVAPLRDQLVRGMLAGHLQGRLRASLTFKAAARDRRVLSDPFRSAIDFLERRLDLPQAALDAIAGQYAGQADEVVIALAGDLSERGGRTLAEIGRGGLHVGEGVARLRDAFDAEGMGPTADYQLQQIYRTNIGTAYAAGQWNANQDPAIREILWGYRYATAGDDRVRPTHAAMDGTTAAKDDPLWQTWWPPCGFNCRCVTIEIWNGEREAVTDIPAPQVNIDGVLVTPGPDEGWHWNPGQVFADSLAAIN